MCSVLYVEIYFNVSRSQSVIMREIELFHMYRICLQDLRKKIANYDGPHRRNVKRQLRLQKSQVKRYKNKKTKKMTKVKKKKNKMLQII